MRELPKGSIVARHRVEGVAGRGGMGVVYRATQLDEGRLVALKLISNHVLEEPGFRERFQREARVARSIDHPNVIPIYEAGEANGHLFITMRYVEGRDLRDVLADEGRIEPRRAIRLVTSVASALDVAHAQGLVHRDVKPANILLAGEGADEHVFLTDFGLSKDTRDEEDVLTGTGQFVGTLDYAAPEQLRCDAPDPRSDVYALGCVLFHALTGQRPFERDSDVATLFAHLNDPPPRVTDLLDGAPLPLDGVIRRVLAKDREERYATAGEFARAAAAALGSGAAHPVPPAAAVTAPDDDAVTEVRALKRARRAATPGQGS